jgi:diacylglycerol kinase
MNILKVFKSFPHAFRGIELVVRERNMQVHIIAVLVVTIAGVLLNISNYEWLIVLLCFGLVMCLEAVNTAIEDVCNKLRDDLGLSYGSTKNARDISAGAVLISAIMSVLVAGVVFLPKITSLF